LGWLVFTAATVAATIMAVACCLVISPAAAGSGIPDVVAYLNGVDVPAVFLFRTLIAKILGSLGSVGGGLAVGKEGPFVHIGACIASLLSQVRLRLAVNLL
jgi:chloride channel 7